ncbi:hypothetical protein LIER_22599 [Lithospermum erythrorhizon]|uniref:Mitochondrial protein n=1 Tax=Lithospermum erythrorhizon TaxID=34254 RepID=A0AAV3QX01_LITER
MKDLSILKYFLGIEVAHSQQGIFLSRRKYTLDIISETSLLGAKPAAFPLEQNHHLGSSDNTVRRCRTFMHAPRFDHWTTALRVVKYLKGSPGQGILLKSACSLHLTGWCDSDWVSCPLTR